MARAAHPLAVQAFRRRNERSFPEEFGRKAEAETTVNVDVQNNVITPAQLKELQRHHVEAIERMARN